MSKFTVVCFCLMICICCVFVLPFFVFCCLNIWQTLTSASAGGPTDLDAEVPTEGAAGTGCVNQGHRNKSIAVLGHNVIELFHYLGGQSTVTSMLLQSLKFNACLLSKIFDNTSTTL